MGWRWCYYLNIIVVGLAIVLLYLFYNPPTFELLHERKSKRQILKKLDCKSCPIEVKAIEILMISDLGILLWTAGLTLFLMGVSLGGTIYPWASAPVISTIVIGIILLIVLFIWEAFADLEYPAIPVKFFRNRGFMSLVCCATVGSVSSRSIFGKVRSLLT